MDIHVVQPGDTIYTIADRYGVSPDMLIRGNELQVPVDLVQGETIVVAYPTQTYVVKEDDTIETIASSNKITINELFRNNPFLSDTQYIYPGEVLVIDYNRIGTVTTHGYTNTYINIDTLRKTLPYLTYLSIFNYRTTRNGELVITSDDSDIIQVAKDYGVIPLILMTTLTVQGEVDLEITYEILINEDSQNRLFDNIVNVIKEHGYMGVNISAQFINTSNQELFDKYASNLSNRLKENGYLTLITINPRIETINLNEVSYERIDYTNIGNLVDFTIFLQYKWGFNFGPPSPVSSLYSISVFLDYIINQINKEKIIIGIPTIGYDWELPYVTGFSKASSLSINSVMSLARNVDAIIEFDEISQTPHFRYVSIGDSSMHEVWFVNATTINELLKMLQSDGIIGTGIWNVMSYYTQLWLVINSQYKILKLLPEV